MAQKVLYLAFYSAGIYRVWPDAYFSNVTISLIFQGWAGLQTFYVTHYIHYIGAILLLGLVAYCILDYFFTGRREFRLTASAYVRILLLGGIVITGIFRVLKNLPDVVFSPALTLFIDIAHLGFMMFYLLAALLFLIIKSGWIRESRD